MHEADELREQDQRLEKVLIVEATAAGGEMAFAIAP